MIKRMIDEPEVLPLKKEQQTYFETILHQNYALNKIRAQSICAAKLLQSRVIQVREFNEIKEVSSSEEQQSPEIRKRLLDPTYLDRIQPVNRRLRARMRVSNCISEEN